MSKGINNPVNGYILAGGKSSRMGIDKGLMMLNGKAIVQHVTEQMQKVAHQVKIISNNPEYEKFGFDVISDQIRNIGPAGGIHAALHDSNSERNFIVSCDIPFITSEAIRFIIERSNLSEITLPIHNYTLEPLFGVYSKECLNEWTALINRGIVKLQDLVQHFKLRLINFDNTEFFNDLLFMNINSKNDFEIAAKLT